MYRAVLSTLVLVPLLGLGYPHLHRSTLEDLPGIVWNDNRAEAGTWIDGELRVALEVRRGRWHPRGPDHPAGHVLAFGEVGRTLQNPGPLMRVPEGTTILVSITNPLDSTLVVHGWSARRVAALDSAVVPPGTTREIRFVADVAGTYYYWGTTTGVPFDERVYEDSQLNGALIIDPADPAEREHDRVLLISRWVQEREPDGTPEFWSEFLTINGRPWPLTERFTYEMGDSIRWRLINASADVHPMHLHGFYYRIDSRGDLAQDTLYWPAARRMAVTERMDPGSTMAMVWSPDRPGGWIFHCHLNYHVVANPGVGDEIAPLPERIEQVMFGDPHHDPSNHVVEGMGGLVLAMHVREPKGWEPAAARRYLRLLVQSDSMPGDSARRYAYVLQDGDREPARDSLRLPGSTLVLWRGEPTSVWVVNRSPAPTQVHWHGLEIESYFDGVTGVGGFSRMPTPPIMPGDSFEMRVTPPRAGSFMYHTHVNDIYQQRLGLYGALLVLDSGEVRKSERDLVFMVGPTPDDGVMLNGMVEPDTVELDQGAEYRFRLMNITLGGPNLQFWLVRDGAPMRWLPIAKDGYDLPGYQRSPVWARQLVSIGETYDYGVLLNQRGSYALEVRRGDGSLVTTQPIRVIGVGGG
ncbi:MAG TPA: multicopper oxidase domain-containing protein [Gemmatimonadales bacterium]|jgi:FtsP/CotA-like multicopper oxidase with cupredoxin domain